MLRLLMIIFFFTATKVVKKCGNFEIAFWKIIISAGYFLYLPFYL